MPHAPDTMLAAENHVENPAIVSAGISRHGLMDAGAAAGAGLVTTTAMAQQAPSTFTNPGPENQGVRRLSPSSDLPPKTDHGAVQQFWASFSRAHRRIQPGGWSRQVYFNDFPISKDMTGVNMRLEAGGIRELHLVRRRRWSIMLTGAGRISAVDLDGRPFLKDVKAGDLWCFPQGVPHSIQGLGPIGREFLLVFDDGNFTEEGTTLLTDWLVDTLRDVVAKNFGVPVGAMQSFNAFPSEGRFIFPAPVPPPPALASDVAALAGKYPMSKQEFSFSLLDMKPTKENASGSIRVVDSNTFKASKTIAAAYVTVKPGGHRELHWRPNGNIAFAARGG